MRGRNKIEQTARKTLKISRFEVYDWGKKGGKFNKNSNEK